VIATRNGAIGNWNRRLLAAALYCSRSHGGETPITTPFGFESTAAEVVEGLDLSGKRVVVTGSASGIGIETARALAGAGADVTLPCATRRR